MKYGIHLPQAGPAASARAIHAVAKHAEDLGYEDVWVSDHIILPRNAEYPPSSYILEPIAALTWAAAVTTRVRLGGRTGEDVVAQISPRPSARIRKVHAPAARPTLGSFVANAVMARGHVAGTGVGRTASDECR